MNMVQDFPDAFGGLVRQSLRKLKQDNHCLRAEVNAQEHRIDRQESMLEELLKEVTREQNHEPE